MDKVKNKILFVDDEKGLRDTVPLTFGGIFRGKDVGEKENFDSLYGEGLMILLKWLGQNVLM